MEIIQDSGAETVVKHNNTEPSAAGFNIKDVLLAVLSKWYWIVLSLIVTMSVASLYLMKTQNIYTRTISVLIKDDSKGSASANVDLSEMGIMQTTTNLDNEIFTLKSADLMDEVVELLGLNDVYMTKRGLKVWSSTGSRPCWWSLSILFFRRHIRLLSVRSTAGLLC